MRISINTYDLNRLNNAWKTLFQMKTYFQTYLLSDKKPSSNHEGGKGLTKKNRNSM